MINLTTPLSSVVSVPIQATRLIQISYRHSSILSIRSHPQCHQIRSKASFAASLKTKRDAAKAARKKKSSTYDTPDMKDLIQFSLCDAIRYFRAFEVGRPQTSPKYEVHIRLKTTRSGPVIKNHLRLPHPVRTDLRIAVIVPSDSADAKAALAAGASLVGTTEIFDAVKEGKIEFDRCIARADCLTELNSSGIARILGPRRLMPSVKAGTVTQKVVATLREMNSASEYRERDGVVRMAVAQLSFTPEQVRDNITALMSSVKADIGKLNDKISKEVLEVVLSSTHGPGISLTGNFRSKDGVDPTELSVKDFVTGSFKAKDGASQKEIFFEDHIKDGADPKELSITA